MELNKKIHIEKYKLTVHKVINSEALHQVAPKTNRSHFIIIRAHEEGG